MDYALERTLESIEAAVKTKAEGKRYDSEWLHVNMCLSALVSLSKIVDDAHDFEAFKRGMRAKASLSRIAAWSLSTCNLEVVEAMRDYYHIHDTTLWIIKGI